MTTRSSAYSHLLREAQRRGLSHRPVNSAISYKRFENDPLAIKLRGAAQALWDTKNPEVMIAGPADTGKTFAALNKLDALCWEFPGCQAVIARKQLTDVFPTCMVTFRKIAEKHPEEYKLRFYGGEKPEWIDYPNGSRIWVAGLDKPGKALSAERDFIYVNQSEELQLEDWETLSTRCSGRAGNAPWTQLFGDCNPGPPHHWILKRANLQVIESRHEDNPTVFDDEGNITESGRKRIAALDALTGVRYSRLRLGKWVAAEGQVYEEWDRAVHLIPRFAIPDDWRRFCAVDFGYSNPFCCQWWAVDGDGRMYMYREIYRTRKLVREHAEVIKEYSAGERITATVCDHDAEDRATLDDCGIPNEAATKSISPGIEAVQARLKTAGDGKPRLFILEDSLIERDDRLAETHKPLATDQEFEVYVWPKAADGKPVKEVPVDMDNHGMDTMRYAVAKEDIDRMPEMRGAI